MIELHDLGKETFTICKNNEDGTCNVLLELPAEMEEQAKYFIDELETYIKGIIEERRVIKFVIPLSSIKYKKGIKNDKLSLRWVEGGLEVIYTGKLSNE